MAEMTREALYYERLDGDRVRCLLCPQVCELGVGESGKCRGRSNVGGKLLAVNYGQSIGASWDPIEKKPLFHFRPGSRILSLGPNSCNLSCFFCQNFSSSQTPCPTSFISPADLAALARQYGTDGVQQVAFTYTEPFTWFEYIWDFSELAPDIDIVLVTNGFVNPQPLAQILPRIKAMNIDLKSIRPEFYTQHCGAKLPAVQQTIAAACKGKVHIELTNLLIPGLNDTDEEILDLARYVASIDKDIPLHFSAYHPAYKARIPATPGATVLRACELASACLSFVYAGNIRSSQYQATFCPNCQATLISAERIDTGLADGRCAHCSLPIYGVW